MLGVTVLVDECRWPWRNRLWCHLVSDASFDELHRFARQLGIPRVAFQGDHYDLDETGRSAALSFGATEVGGRDLVRALKASGLRRGPNVWRGGMSAVASMDAPRLTTERLVLRQWQPTDFEFARKLDTDPKIMKLMGGTRTAEQTIAQLNQDAVGLALRGIGKWAVELQSNHELVGRVGLGGVNDALPFGPALQLGWRMSSKYQGFGFATEAARAALIYAFDVLEVERVAAITVPHNHASLSVMAKLGMHDDGEFDHPSFGESDPLRRHVLKWANR